MAAIQKRTISPALWLEIKDDMGKSENTFCRGEMAIAKLTGLSAEAIKEIISTTP